MNRFLVEKDLKYVKDKKTYNSRTQLTISKLLDFLDQKYIHNYSFKLKDKSILYADFKMDNDKYICIIESEDDLENFRKIKLEFPDEKIIGIGGSKLVGKLSEIDSLFLYTSSNEKIGSIFIEDPSLAFDYAHILPLVQKCSILHGHTATVMVEIIGTMKNGLVIDFSEAKQIIKEVLSKLDHKFYINKEYLVSEDELHYIIKFNGPQGFFQLQLPRSTTYMMSDEATVENLSKEILKLLIPKMPSNIEALGVYIYEGVNKGAHILSNIRDT